MKIESPAVQVVGQTLRAATVTISPWVNETLPDIRAILGSRDIARLTRRPRWELFGLALLGKFPRKKRYRGRTIGWCRAEVLEWMSSNLSIEVDHLERLNTAPRCARLRPRQECLPLEHAALDARTQECSARPRSTSA